MSSKLPLPLIVFSGSTVEAFVGFSILVQKDGTQIPLSALFLGFSALNFGVWGFYQMFIYPFFISPLRHLPRPKGELPFIGHGTTPFKRPLGTAQLKWIKETPNDGLLTYRGLFHQDRLLITNPKAVADVLVHNSYAFEKPKEVRTFLSQFLGDGLIIVEGDEHRFQRKHMMPAFSFRHIKNLYPIFWSKAMQLNERVAAEIMDNPAQWPGEPPQDENEKLDPSCGKIEINHWANKTTIDIIGVAGLGKDFGTLQGEVSELVDTYEEILEPTNEKQLLFGVNLLLPQRLVKMLPWKLNERVKVTTGLLRRYCWDLVNEGRQRVKIRGPDEQQINILDLLIESNDFSDDQLVSQLLTFLAAGHETTSSAFTWTCYILAKNASIQNRLRSEIHSALGEELFSTDTSAPPPANLSSTLESLPYLNAVCNEVLRFYPTVPLTARISTQPTVICGIPVPAGTRVTPCPWALNHSPTLWGPDAETFNPDRWLDPDTGKVNNNGGVDSAYANMTFLHGPRSCIGQGFAKAELRALVAAWAGKWESRMQRPNEEPEVAGVITTKPRGGVNMIIRKVGEW